jgi:hypothetical protein
VGRRDHLSERAFSSALPFDKRPQPDHFAPEAQKRGPLHRKNEPLMIFDLDL